MKEITKIKQSIQDDIDEVMQCVTECHLISL